MAATIATGLVAAQLLLLLCTAATATPPPPGFVNGAAPPSTDEGGVGLPKLPFPFPGAGGLPHLPFPFPFPFPGAGGLPHLPFPFPGSGNNDNNPAAGADCLNAVRQGERCAYEVLRSLTSPSPGADVVSAGRACCAALQAVGHRCFRGVLPASPFRALLEHACDGGGVPSLGLLAPGPRV